MRERRRNLFGATQCREDVTRCLFAGFVLVTILIIANDTALAQNWTAASTPSAEWTSLAMSADGRVIAGCTVVPDAIYTSTNWGGSWTSNTFTNANWHSIAVSPDGTTLAATTLHPQYGTVYISMNSGATWTSN